MRPLSRPRMTADDTLVDRLDVTKFEGVLLRKSSQQTRIRPEYQFQRHHGTKRTSQTTRRAAGHAQRSVERRLNSNLAFHLRHSGPEEIPRRMLHVFASDLLIWWVFPPSISTRTNPFLPASGERESIDNFYFPAYTADKHSLAMLYTSSLSACLPCLRSRPSTLAPSFQTEEMPNVHPLMRTV